MDVSAGKAVVRDEIEASPRRLTTVVAADICGYSRLAEASDEAAVRTVTIVRAAFERVVANRRGRIFHAAGDGFLAEFPSAADGVLAALEFVADIRARNNLSPTSPGAAVRAGVHAGDVVEQPGGDLLGHGVNVAARLQGEAEPNGVLVSLAVVNLVRGGVDAHFSRRGPLALKNIDEPVVAFDAMEGGARARRAFLSILKNHRVQIAGLILLALVAVNIGVMGLSLRRPAPPASRDASDEPTRAANALTDRLIRRLDANRRGDYADPLRFESASKAVVALQRSDRADKAVTVVSLIDRGELNSAAEMLERIYEEQTAAGLSASARIETLSQIAAVIFHQDTTKAIARNVELLTLAEGPDFEDDGRVLFAHYALAALYHRVNDPERANAHFAAMLSRAPEDDEVRIWAELGFLNSWLMKPEIGPADFDQIEARLQALQPSLAAYQRKHANAEFWSTYASLDYFRGGFSGDAATKQSAVEKQRRAIAIEQDLAIGRKSSAALARAYMRLGAL
ncbi:MAG: adenylate/guanylate cyclase domain-containing protein, partial [Parvularculaceae bacterium]|nr:adenylate/guanylate cyclase domain-containing protein [Parvularculaceae bacterium]